MNFPTALQSSAKTFTHAAVSALAYATVGTALVLIFKKYKEREYEKTNDKIRKQVQLYQNLEAAALSAHKAAVAAKKPAVQAAAAALSSAMNESQKGIPITEPTQQEEVAGVVSDPDIPTPTFHGGVA